MKTTEKVNIAGYSFTLEEDAYSELDRYIGQIRASLSENSNADEIVQDIEERIAELLGESCPSGTVVNKNMVLDIRRRIGEPAQFSAEENASADEKPKTEKRLYRDLENRVVGGVCSGIGNYFNIGYVIIRLIFIVLFMASFMVSFVSGPFFMFVLMMYLCLWIAMPPARSVEEKCKMKGKPISLSNFRTNFSPAAIAQEAQEIKDSPAIRTAGRIFSSIMGILLTMGGFGCLLSLIFIHKTPDLISLYTERHAQRWATDNAYDVLWVDIMTHPMLWWLVIAVVGILGIWMLYNGLRLAFDLKAPSWKPGIVLFVLWVISILALVTWVLAQVAEALPLFI